MFRQFARLLAVSLVLVCHPTAALQDHRVSTDSAVQGVHFCGLCDAFTKTDGAQVYLSSPWGPMQLQEGKPEQLYDIPNRSLSRITFVSLFEHPTEPDSRYAIAWLDARKMNGMGIYLLTPEEARLVCHIGERMRQPNFYQSENGDIFVSSRSGVVYWWDRQQLRRFALSIDPGLTIDLRKLFRRVEFTSWPGGPVCCYSVANPKYHERALFDIAVADPETGWRTISLDGRVTGPATMTNANTLRMLQYDRWINVDLASGEVTAEQFAVPREGDARVTPTFVTALPDGTLISLWRKMYRSYRPYDVDAFADGRFQQVCEWRDAAWHVVAGKDRLITKQTLHVTDDDGGWWVVTGESSLLYRNPAGQYREFDFQHGIAMTECLGFKRDGPETLWMLDQGSALRIDWRQLADQSATIDTNWLEIFSRHRIDLSWPAPFDPLSPFLTMEGDIICHSDLQQCYKFPSSDVLPVTDNKFWLFEDNQGRPWVVGYGQHPWKVTGWVDQRWQVFEPQVDPVEPAAENVALWFSQRELVSPGAVLGNRIAWGPDGRIAVKDRTVSLYDGQRWLRAVGDQDGPRTRTWAVSFTDSSVMIWQNLIKAWKLPFYQWPEITDGQNEWPWQEVQHPAGVPSDWRTMRERNAGIFEDSPVDQQARKYQNNIHFAQFGQTQIAVNHGLGWTSIPNVNSPFPVPRRITRVRRHPLGHWVFVHEQDGIHRYLVYAPPAANLKAVKRDLGAVDEPEQMLEPEWTSDEPLGDVQCRFRIDNGPWAEWQMANQPIQSGAVVTPGQHRLQVQLHSTTLLLPDRPLEYTFEVKYDVSERIMSLIGQLNAMDFELRNEAEKELVGMGVQILETLRHEFARARDPQSKAGIARVIRQIEQPSETKDD